MIWTRRASFGESSDDAWKNFRHPSESVARCTAKTSLNRDSSHAGVSFRVRKGPREEAAGHQLGRRKRPQADSFSEQPVAAVGVTVPCEVCGLRVNQKRLQAHMVRFHGASLA